MKKEKSDNECQTDAQLNCASVWRGFYSVYKFPNGHRFQKTTACGFLPQGAGR